jgi:hypothetical protein
MNGQSILEQLGDVNPEAELFENMSAALIGFGRCGSAEPVAIYSKAGIYSKLLEDGLSEAEAEDYFMREFASKPAGINTPFILADA